MDYRLALDLGTNSIGWSVLRLKRDEGNKRFYPMAIVRAGSRIFSDGRHPKTGTSLAVERRIARGARRRRDRYLRRRSSVLRQLVQFGFYPESIVEQKALVVLDPYELRARGLDSQLTPEEFGRALFHINQRRGFKSNRKTDSADAESGLLKQAIADFKIKLEEQGARTVGEMLYKRTKLGLPVRARLRTRVIQQDDGRNRNQKSYDLYVERGMMLEEFELLWESQRRFNPQVFNDISKEKLRSTIFYQRPLKPVDPGRCSFFPNEYRCAEALPITQKFKIYQDANNLRYLGEDGSSVPLTLQQRDIVVTELSKYGKRTFKQLRKKLRFPDHVRFSVEDEKRTELHGDKVAAVLSKPHLFGNQWFDFEFSKQTEIVKQLLEEENEAHLIDWLITKLGVSIELAKELARVNLPSGYISLSEKALNKIVSELKTDVVTYNGAVERSGLGSHSMLEKYHDGEIMDSLPYYGEVLERRVGFGSNNLEDSDEVRFGRINNPTVHIGLNQVRVLVNELLKEYGHPKQIVVEVARELKLGREAKERIQRQQADNQKRNLELREKIAGLVGKSFERVTREEIQKYLLWEELAFNPNERACPYTGRIIPVHKIYSNEVEIEHILPFSITLDDSMNNKTLSYVGANRDKGNRTPYEAFGKQVIEGYDYQAILARTQGMSRQKASRFAPDGYEIWLRDNDGFLARALNDTAYLSRMVKEYVSVICPKNTIVIPGQLTAMLRQHFGLNNVLGVTGQKNRDDHRHHAVDACVIGVTDPVLLKRFADANKTARGVGSRRLVEQLSPPWPNYRMHVERAVNNIWVSNKPDHGYQGQFHNASAFGQYEQGKFRYHDLNEGKRIPKEKSNPKAMVSIATPKANERHGLLPDGSAKPYKFYLKDSNYCIEIYRTNSGKWEAEVISTFNAYQIVKNKGGIKSLRNPQYAQNGQPLVMRLMRGDMLRLEHNERKMVVKVCKIDSSTRVVLAEHFEANVDARNRDKRSGFKYIYKMPSTLLSSKARLVTISPAGKLRDPGFKE